LAQLNNCYNQVQMMEAILAKVMTDLVTNNTAVQQAIVEAIAASGSNVPLIGVTNGSNAQPGQVGEYIEVQNMVSVPTGYSQTPQSFQLGAGDWLVIMMATPPGADVTNINYGLYPPPAGASTALAGALSLVTGGPEYAYVVGTPGRCNFTAPTLLPFQFSVTATTATSIAFLMQAWRMR
jgi:hypothetical protein